jgi:hypothetical protein
MWYLVFSFYDNYCDGGKISEAMILIFRNQRVIINVYAYGDTKRHIISLSNYWYNKFTSTEKTINMGKTPNVIKLNKLQ